MPEVADIINWGFENHQKGNFDEAESAYNEVLSMDSQNADACNLLSVLKLQRGEVDEAIKYSKRAIGINPCEYYYETLFQAYIRGGMYKEIANCAGNVIKQFPKSFVLLFNVALAFKNLKQYTKSIDFYDRALKINPASYEAWSNLALVYSIEGQHKNAVSALKICNKLRPNDKETQYFLSIALMSTKNYNKALKMFENRICRDTAVALMEKTYPNLCSKDRLWKGENIKDKTIFVYYEAGFGDVIMFSRYLPLLKKRCKKLILYPQKPLVSLLANSGLGIDEIVEGYIPEQDLNFDVHAPILSLPYLLGLKDKDIFEASDGYLLVDRVMAEDYKAKFFDNKKVKIGIKWQGNTYYDKERVIPAEAFAPLIEVENTQFYSFQTFEGAQDINKLTDKYNIIDIGKDLVDFSQTAAAMANLDFVICNDTSLAHLAGALGIQCVVMLPYEVNWRWHNGEGDCEWYDSVQLVRQKSPGDWDGVIKEISEKLSIYLKEQLSRR